MMKKIWKQSVVLLTLFPMLVSAAIVAPPSAQVQSATPAPTPAASAPTPTVPTPVPVAAPVAAPAAPAPVATPAAPIPIQASDATPAAVAPQASAKVKAQAWQIIPEQSSIQFVGTLNGGSVVGKFTRFKGDINFDPKALNNSHVKITIDISSVSTSYRDIEDTLKAGDWLAMNMFPTAVYESNNFQYVKDGQFKCNGNLTIRDKTLPMTLTFTAAGASDQTTQTVTGTGVIKRTEFGIGRGEWAAVGDVGDNVTINFSLVAKKK